MKITIEDLKRYNACGPGIEFMEKYYPDGGEIIDIIKDDRASLEMLHFGYKYLTVTPDEVKAYRRRCDIDEASRFVWYSDHVENSTGVTGSRNIADSKYIADCTNVNNSHHIYNSHDINASHEVVSSSKIKGSDCVIESHDIVNCAQINKAKLISWSQFIIYSFLVEDSQFIYKGENIQDCYFCGFMKNSRHCMFCTGITDGEYMIFNQKVAPAVFEEWKEKLLFQLQGENAKLLEIQPHKHTSEERYSYSNRLDAIFNSLSSDFYGWVGTIPYYDEKFFLNLFFSKK